MGLAQTVCETILGRREDALRATGGGYARSNPIPSDLSECTRAMVLSITHWQDRPPFEPFVKARLNRGKLIEDAILRELAELGISVRQDRKPFEIKDDAGRRVLRGRLDGFIQWEGRREVPLECKSVDPNVFRSLKTLADFERYWYTRRWPLQLQCYLYAENLDEGILLLDDCLGHWRLLPVPIDFEVLEPIIKRCEETVAHVAAQTLPDFHPNAAVCRRCWCFNRVCIPPVENQGLTALDDPEFLTKLERREALAPLRSEYEALDDEIKERVRGKDGLVVGEFLIQGKETVTQRKAQEAKTIIGWRTSITKLEAP